jgi:malate dehydrogenase
MVSPLIVLSVLSVVAGWTLPGGFGVANLIEQSRPAGTVETATGGFVFGQSLTVPAEYLSHEGAIHVTATMTAFGTALAGVPGVLGADVSMQGAVLDADTAIDEVASADARVLVVGNPCNTNAYIASQKAKRIPRGNFTAMTRLDQNRAVAQLSAKAGVGVGAIGNLAVWGNHSPTMYPDFTHATINGRKLTDVITDHEWLNGAFLKTVQQRGKAIIEARGKSSAASAAWAAIDHMKDWWHGTQGRWVSMAVVSDGSYGVPEGLISSFPCTVDSNGQYHVVQGLELDATAQGRVQASVNELLEEREFIKDLV